MQAAGLLAAQGLHAAACCRLGTTQPVASMAASAAHGLQGEQAAAHGVQGLQGEQAAAAHGLHGLQAAAAQGLHGLQEAASLIAAAGLAGRLAATGLSASLDAF
ncbi:MAG TPA: hypothetical protein VMO81_06890 [Aestuariivirgaceae bacterium]|nr:hypothetical protein [Aestuariivirgaceae bacterium]